MTFCVCSSCAPPSAVSRREFLCITAASAVAASTVAGAMVGTARAQQPRKIPRLCFLTFDPGSLQSTRFSAFFEGLRDLGYVQGQSILIDYLTADGQAERYSALAAECVRLGADVIATSTTPATQAAKSATQAIPIVMIGALRHPSITSGSGNEPGRVVPASHANELSLPLGVLVAGVLASKSKDG